MVFPEWCSYCRSVPPSPSEVGGTNPCQPFHCATSPSSKPSREPPWQRGNAGNAAGSFSPWKNNRNQLVQSGFPIHQLTDFVRFLKNPVFCVRSFLSSVRSFFWPQLHRFWAQLDRFPVYLGLRWFESSISWKFYIGFHVKTNFQKLWKPQFSQLDKICAQLG